ncbi:zinc-ribbon domain-containing protein [Actinomycetospora straminea]|uniref:Zinc-ribbon 15 domain-containing protein n=1 Tax=Actinomycetospora straminea TaxID=663607 RepID=A0ABP9E382_9PSEU|nr:zinc-ribbon domain-containing protein [Actinomycetospora straminea]MDD7931434.1 zinc-ribbon domain-containing protein [Actinomycetospora straminea]
MIIFGTRRTVTQLAMVVLTCVNCHRSAANAVIRAVTKFTLFFIPLFPIRTRYATQCTACGFLMWVDKGQAEQLRQAPPAGAAGPPPLPGQYQAGQYPAGPYGQQQYPPYPQQQAAPGMPGAAPWSAPHDGGTNGHAARNN